MSSGQMLNAGDLDLTFGQTGYVAPQFIAPGNTLAPALITRLLVQPDNKIVVAGTAAPFPSTRGNFGVDRLNPDGTLDSSFGTGGRVSTDFGGVAQVTSAVLQSDGKILLVGDRDQLGSNFAMARYNADGSPDTGFGTGGKVLMGVPLSPPSDVVVEGDGKIVVALQNRLIRFDADGTFDTTFGTGGVITLPIFGARLALQPDGRLLVVDPLQGMARYNPDGTLDPTFGMNGATGIPGGAFALQPDGKIVITRGTLPSGGGGIEYDLFRYDVNGNADLGRVVESNTSFGGNAFVPAVAVQADGRILFVAQWSLTLPRPAGGSGVYRVDPNGILDAGFAMGGRALVGAAGQENLALQSDGKILFGDTQRVVRLLTNDPLPTAGQRFVAQVYLDLLHRTADPAGLAGWSALIDQGRSTPEQVALDIEASPEYLNLKVQELFGMFLNRPAMPDEASAYAHFLAAGGTIEQMEVTLTGSPEYYQTRGGGTTNEGFLGALYRDALGRTVDPTGMSGFVHALNSNALSTAQVAAQVFGSDEYFGHLGRNFYHEFLHREADQPGLNGVTGALQRGITDQAIIASIMGSDEYLTHRT